LLLSVKVTKTINSTLTQLVQTKFDMGTYRLDNYHQSLWQLIARTVQCVLA